MISMAGTFSITLLISALKEKGGGGAGEDEEEEEEEEQEQQWWFMPTRMILPLIHPALMLPGWLLVRLGDLVTAVVVVQFPALGRLLAAPRPPAALGQRQYCTRM